MEPRQLWWIASAGATLAGLALLAFRRSPATIALAVVLFVVPHAIGAPQPPSPATNVPPELAREFIVAVILTGLLFWALLGALAGGLYRRMIDASPPGS